MAAGRKLQAEVDKLLKKVDEGLEEFNSLWDSLRKSDNPNQKEKFESELKSQIKKLQRDRDQIKSWLADKNIKEKAALSESKKRIEVEMERFKELEREVKTKQFSKEGLAKTDKVDPQEEERRAQKQWIQDAIDGLTQELDELTAEIEKKVGGGTKKKKERSPDESAAIAHLKDIKDAHSFHISRLEALLRKVINDAVDLTAVEELKDTVDYYVSGNSREAGEFNDFREIYDAFGLESNEDAGRDRDAKSDADDGASSVGAPDSEAAEAKSSAPPPPSPPSTPKRAVTGGAATAKRQKDEAAAEAKARPGPPPKEKQPLKAAPVTAPAPPVKAVVQRTTTAPSPAPPGPPPAPERPPVPGQAPTVGKQPPPPKNGPGPPPQAPPKPGQMQAAPPPPTQAPPVPQMKAPPPPGQPRPTAGTMNMPAPPSMPPPAPDQAQQQAVAHREPPSMPPPPPPVAPPPPPPVASTTAAATVMAKNPPPAQNPPPPPTAQPPQPDSRPADAPPQPPVKARPQASDKEAADRDRSRSMTPSDSGKGSTGAPSVAAAAAAATRNVPPPPAAQPPPPTAPAATAPAASPEGTPRSVQRGTAGAGGGVDRADTPNRGRAEVRNGQQYEQPQRQTLQQQQQHPPQQLIHRQQQQQAQQQAQQQQAQQAQQQAAAAPLQLPHLQQLHQLQHQQQHHRLAHDAHQRIAAAGMSMAAEPSSSTYGEDAPSASQMRTLERLGSGYGDLPTPGNGLRPRSFVPMHPYVHKDAQGNPMYPTKPLKSFEAPEAFDKYDLDLLFFIFYYQVGTTQQYLAAKELKKLAWRFHTKYHTWFQRHEEPKQTAPDFERGTYIYFDKESWCKRVKYDFAFEYQYLEDDTN